MIKDKLHSQSGASITFALLLFLVCAVLSAIILVAGTSAAGRISGLKESDQRYYAVTSAALAIENMMDGATVTVVGDKCFAVPLGEVTEDTASGDTQTGTLPLYTASVINSSANLKLEAGSGLGASLNVEVYEEVDTDGNATFTIYNTTGDHFKMKLEFAADQKVEDLPFMKNVYSADPTASTGTEYTWHLERMTTAYDSPS